MGHRDDIVPPFMEPLIWRGDRHNTVGDPGGYLWQEGLLDPEVKGGWGFLAEAVAAP